MDAFPALNLQFSMFYQLPPAGSPICLSGAKQPEQFLRSFFLPYEIRFFASGTAALAAAITTAILKKNTASPEVILPAYGCPDLISAAVFAEAKPVLVDLEPDRAWIDLEQLHRYISSRTVAIIAVSLLGISERMTELRAIAEQSGILLIEDSAQAFPRGEEPDFWQGDLVVLSFGRGKPVSVLGGGAVLYRQASLGDILPQAATQADQRESGQQIFRLKSLFYNRLISPHLYWIPNGIPLLHLGETRYHPLSNIDAIDSAKLAILPTNITGYQNNNMDVQTALAEMLEEIIPVTSGLVDLPRVSRISPERRLLRYPLLVDSANRNRFYQQLRRLGAGVSIMYPAALTGISGLERMLQDQGPFSAAESLAERILTLPTHNRVGYKDIANMRQVLGSR